MLFRVHVDARDENAVDALESFERRTTLGSAPHGVAGRFVLTHREDQSHVERYAGSAQLLDGIQTGRRCRYFDHAVVVALGPFLSQLDVRRYPVLMRERVRWVFEQ